MCIEDYKDDEVFRSREANDSWFDWPLDQDHLRRAHAPGDPVDRVIAVMGGRPYREPSWGEQYMDDIIEEARDLK
jgi:hypothetical protein